jgi:hypothetical protein
MPATAPQPAAAITAAAPRRGVRRPRRAGFTIIEALLAGMILAIVGVAITSAATRALHHAETARGYEHAAELLDRTMTRIDLIGPERLLREGPLQGEFAAPDQMYRWEADIESLTLGDLYEVTVRVSWPTGAGRRSAQLSTRLNDAPGSRDISLQWEDL